MDLGLSGKVAWITGGGGDIGSAIATELASEGAKLAITGRNQDRLRARAAEIAAATGAEVIAVPADVTSTAEVKAAAAAIMKRLGAIEIVVNSAATPGGKANGPLETIDDAQLLADLDQKYVSCLRTAQAAAPSMKQRGWGRLIHISGLNARQSGTYSAGGRNLAMVHLSKTLSDELGEYGITSNVVHPAAIHGSGGTDGWQLSLRGAASRSRSWRPRSPRRTRFGDCSTPRRSPMWWCSSLPQSPSESPASRSAPAAACTARSRSRRLQRASPRRVSAPGEP
jgi:NAD(P)-dependent dehydrogenase (short-subunit alcohol dehydrogenase family)